MAHFDLAVIGTGPSGQHAAIQAAKLGKSVVIIEKNKSVGGVAVNTGTIPSKALREAALRLTGADVHDLFGHGRRLKQSVTVADLVAVGSQVVQHEWALIQDAFLRNGVELIYGAARFSGPNSLRITHGGDDEAETVTADKFLIAIGTRPAKPPEIPFDDETVFTSDELLTLDRLPRNMIVVGGGVVGAEYTCIMSTLGVRVTLVEGRNRVLGFLDQEIAEAFQYLMRQAGVTLRLSEKVAKVERIGPSTATGMSVQATLESGKKLQAQTVLYAVGRVGLCAELGLEAVGLKYDDRERLKVNEHFQTEVPYIYAAGDVIGFPALASTAMEQGRLAACHMFGVEAVSMPHLLPYGVYAVPEISMVGKTEEQLTEAAIPYEVGIGFYRETARGQILGDNTGMLKLLIHQENHQILGVHIIGTGATELVHIGQAVMAFNGTVEFFVNNVFNYPTLAEAYRIAALNGVNKLLHV